MKRVSAFLTLGQNTVVPSFPLPDSLLRFKLTLSHNLSSNIISYDAEPFGSPWFVDIWNQLSNMMQYNIVHYNYHTIISLIFEKILIFIDNNIY